MKYLYFIIIFFSISVKVDAQTKSYSTVDSTSRYTQCFKEIVDSFDNILSYRLSKLFYTLRDIERAVSKEQERWWTDTAHYSSYKPDFDTLLSIKKRTLTASDKKYIEGVLSKIINSIYSITADKEFNVMKGEITPFNCKLSGSGLNLIAPSKENWSLLFPEDIIRTIYHRSLVDVFIWKDTTKSNPFHEDEVAVEMETPLSFLLHVYRNNTHYPPCIPVLRQKDFLTLINNKSIRKDTLTPDDIETLDMIKNTVSAEGFWGEILCNCDFKSEYAWELFSCLDRKKLPADLLAIIDKASSNQIDDRFLERVYDNWIIRQVMVSLHANYISMEIVKYLVFAIAHECYHSWFAYGLIGKTHEFNADAYATYIYLKVFTDKKIMHDFVKLLDFSSMTGGVEDENNELSEEMLNETLRPYVGRPIVQIFSEVLKTNSFYEKNDAFHPPFKERISAIDNIIGESMDSEEILIKLKNKLISIFATNK